MINGKYNFTGTGLYVHVPFCASKCSYCGFYSVSANDELIGQYLDKLEKEANQRVAEVSGCVHTVFIGGGNPLTLGLSGIQRLARIIMQIVNADEIKEWTFEANPESLTEEIASFLADLPGIRLSMGVQRLKDSELRILGRRATMDNVYNAMELAGKRIENLGIDLILGVPDCPSIARDLAIFLDRFRVNHLSSYFLSIESNSELEKSIAAGEFSDPDECGPEELFEVSSLLQSRNFEHYEISNFALEGFRCLHNMNYWKPGNYLGLGPSAVSTQGDLRKYNVPDLKRWLNDEQPVYEQLSPVDRRNEYLMLRMRLLKDGVNVSSLERRFGPQSESFYMELQWHIEQGNIEKAGDVVRLTRKGIAFSDTIISALFI
ncbi:MAG: radical SAM family heme chaperone HemW [Candidatus Rifleibacteriota bacterium]